jgi:hypothetical protein
VPQIVFLSLFLGLITGIQSVDLQVDVAVKSVRIELGGREVARMDKAPWSAKVDFGRTLTPNELTAIAYDANGKEVARTSQLINLSRPPAELEIVIRKEGQRPVQAELVGRHRLHKSPESAKLLVDGTAVRVGRDFRAQLPEMDSSHPHVISAEMKFEDGEIAKREIVIQAGFSGSTGSELTPLLVTSKEDKQPSSLEGCFSAGGAPLKASAIEKSDAFVVLVKDPAMRPQLLGSTDLRLDADTAERILWPVSRPINGPGEPTAIAFPQSINHGKVATASWLLKERLSPSPAASEPRQFTDAVAVAAMSTLERGRRRAVVLVVSKAPDRSLYSPLIVRRYLEEVGVPLFVWSADGPRPDLTGAWGQIDDISTAAGLEAAVARLNRALMQQRVVWVAAGPLRALRAEGTEGCGLTPVAHRSSLQPPP